MGRHELESRPDSENRMDTFSTNLRVGGSKQPFRATSDRPLCEPLHSQTRLLRVTLPRPDGVLGRRSDRRLAEVHDSLCFPPTCIMDKVIVKIQQEKPNKLILLAPMHTKAAWFPFLSSWSKTSLVIPSNQLTLEQPHFEYKHPNSSTLCLTMFHIDYQN